MKRLVLVLALLAVATALLASNVQQQFQVDAYSVEVSIAPSARDAIQLLDRQTPFTYTCRAEVVDAATRTPIGSVKAIVAQGGTESATMKNRAWTTTLTVKMSRRAERADTEVIVKKDDKVVSRHVTRVQLKNVDPGIVPIR